MIPLEILLNQTGIQVNAPFAKATNGQAQGTVKREPEAGSKKYSLISEGILRTMFNIQ
jgi:hypothetical protein